MKIKWTPKLFITFSFIMPFITVNAQVTTQRVLTVNELFTLVKENHPSLKPYKTGIDIAKENTNVAKNQRLPEINTSIQAYYLGDASIIDKDFSNSTKVDMPNFGNKFSIDAHQLIWKGNTVNNGIKIGGLKEELAELNYQTNEQNIKLLVLAYYFDLYKLNNQEDVYTKNIDLAVKRLDNINKFYKQGMVTRNDVIRGELQLSNLELAVQVVRNNQQILNKQLTVALGLSPHTLIVPEKALVEKTGLETDLDSYQEQLKNHPAIQMAQKSAAVYQVAEKMTKAELLPTLMAFASNSLQRPITTSSPAIDMYSNGWSAGLALSFNIDALYKSPKRLHVAKLEREKALYEANDIAERVDVSVNTAFIKYNEAVTQNNTLKVNTDLTDENYRIMESKYNNQLAILLDLIDASNAKLDAELQYVNSEINIVYSYYKMLKELGSL